MRVCVAVVADSCTTSRMASVASRVYKDDLMCRLFGLRSGEASGVNHHLASATNALRRQSEKHKDGWGIAYYSDGEPTLVRDTKKALDDQLFAKVASMVTTRALVAHIRQASVGSVAVANCHPFRFGRWVFAHNGEIGGYGDNQDVRARCREAIAPDLRKHILGATDSEVAFHVFLTQVARRVYRPLAKVVPSEAVIDGLKAAVDILYRAADPDAPRPTALNFLTTNGSLMVAHRMGRPLFVSTYNAECDTCSGSTMSRFRRDIGSGAARHILIASEPLEDTHDIWKEVAEGEVVAIDHEMQVSRLPQN